MPIRKTSQNEAPWTKNIPNSPYNLGRLEIVGYGGTFTNMDNSNSHLMNLIKIISLKRYQNTGPTMNAGSVFRLIGTEEVKGANYTKY